MSHYLVPTHCPTAPFAHTSGPRNARIVLVGEAWGKDEELTKLPFIGQSGQELTRILRDAGIQRAECLLTNVLALRPPNNDLDSLCASRKEVGADYSRKQLRLGKYLRPEFLCELDRLATELRTVAPNIVVALGNVACWALLGSAGIGTLRGAVAESTLVPGLKVLPTYHPAAILRNWSWRAIAVADLMKASRESAFSEIRRPKRQLTINPTLTEIDDWIVSHANAAKLLAVDIETTRRQIDMIGFATSPSDALVVPFIDPAKPGWNYWQNPEDEAHARVMVQRILITDCPKVTQNGLYDIQYLLREGFRLRNFCDDTMLLHHSLYPELQKGLGFLGSIYTNESSWKLLNRGKELKKDD